MVDKEMTARESAGRGLNNRSELETLMRGYFPELNAGVLAMLRAVSEGTELTFPRDRNPMDALIAARRAHRTVRAALIRRLMVDQRAVSHVDPKGILLSGA
jgi:hypothetical protein